MGDTTDAVGVHPTIHVWSSVVSHHVYPLSSALDETTFLDEFGKLSFPFSLCCNRLGRGGNKKKQIQEFQHPSDRYCVRLIEFSFTLIVCWVCLCRTFVSKLSYLCVCLVFSFHFCVCFPKRRLVTIIRMCVIYFEVW